jgi:hypothetical protein
VGDVWQWFVGLDVGTEVQTVFFATERADSDLALVRALGGDDLLAAALGDDDCGLFAHD